MKLFIHSKTSMVAAHLKFWKGQVNFVPHFIWHLILYTCWDYSWSMLVKGSPGGIGNGQRWGWFNIKMPSYQYRKSWCGEKMILRPSYLHNGISHNGKMISLYWIRALRVSTVSSDNRAIVMTTFPFLWLKVMAKCTRYSVLLFSF